MLYKYISAIREKTKAQFEKKYRSVFSFIKAHIHPCVIGGKHPTEENPVFLNKQPKIIDAYNTKNFRQLYYFSNDDLLDHFTGKETYYFTGRNRFWDRYTLVMGDIDCHKTGTLQGALSFVKHLRTFWPDLYFEVSTNGNGVHFYFFLSKWGTHAQTANKQLKKLERMLKELLKDGEFDVEDVEIKGTPSEFHWCPGSNKLLNIKNGFLAKIPRELLTRFEEFKNTTRIDIHELMNVPEIEIEVEPKRKCQLCGSVSGMAISEQELQLVKTQYLRLAQDLMEASHLETGGRSVVVPLDLAQSFAILKYISKRPNANQALPTNWVKRLWQEVYRAGDFERSFDSQRWKVIRDFLSDKGLINWVDNTYCAGEYAMKWGASQKLLALLETKPKITQRGGVSSIRTECSLNWTFAKSG